MKTPQVFKVGFKGFHGGTFSYNISFIGRFRSNPFVVLDRKSKCIAGVVIVIKNMKIMAG